MRERVGRRREQEAAAAAAAENLSPNRAAALLSRLLTPPSLPPPRRTQGFDPSHGPWLHHGLAGLSMADSEPMPAEALPVSKISASSGFEWRHGAYSKKYHGMKGVRVFEPPNVFT